MTNGKVWIEMQDRETGERGLISPETFEARLRQREAPEFSTPIYSAVLCGMQEWSTPGFVYRLHRPENSK